MDNAIRDYAWGSKSQLAQFLGRKPTGKPEAELWIGAHDGNPSAMPDGRLLNDAIAEDAATLLGTRVCDIFGDRLPYLMKVLAVDDVLSLQVHPSSERARIGHRLETMAGVDVGDAKRNYKDQWHKPEMIFAVTRFEGYAGFRDPERTAAMLRLLNVPWSDDIADRLEAGPAYQALQAITTEILHLEGKLLARILRDVGDAARHAGARASREELRHRQLRKGGEINAEAARVFTNIGELVKGYPRDPGVLVTLLLNNVMLAPGESMFVDAGVIHAYASGFGVEIMASSDNVLRAGLTPKHMDVEELLHITNFTPIPPPRWDPAEKTRTFQRLEPPVAEFSLIIGEAPVARLPITGPRTVLVLDGYVDVTTTNGAVRAGRGQSVFVAHADGAMQITGDGRVAVGSVPA